jgi:hypothetical protein
MCYGLHQSIGTSSWRAHSHEISGEDLNDGLPVDRLALVVRIIQGAWFKVIRWQSCNRPYMHHLLENGRFEPCRLQK